MGYDIQIRTLFADYEEYTQEQILEKDYKYELNDISETIEDLHMTYNHCGLFKELGIYPSDFNGKRVKDILPVYIKALETLKSNDDNKDKDNDDNLDKDIVSLYDNSSNYYDFTSQSNINYFEVSNTVIYVVISEVIKTLKKCNDDDFWISD